eukprot:6475554-Amphidinium_carterae.2
MVINANPRGIHSAEAELARLVARVWGGGHGSCRSTLRAAPESSVDLQPHARHPCTQKARPVQFKRDGSRKQS